MQIIKPILILCFVIVLIVVFRQRGRAGLRAGSRIAALLLGVSAIVFVIEPDIPQALADLVGVVRGTDLILYILVVVFAVTSLGLYFGQRAAEVQIQRLARRIALSDAIAADGPPGHRDRQDGTLPAPHTHLAGESTAAVQPTSDPSRQE
jgi:hypothetical protein